MYDIPVYTLVFAQCIGLFLVIMTVIMVARAKYYRNVIQHLKSDDSVIPVSASVSLIFGLLLLVTHNVWKLESDSLIIVVGWVLIIKSVLWLSLPERMLAWSQKMYASCWYYIMAFIVAITGVLLLTHGYYMFMPKGWVIMF